MKAQFYVNVLVKRSTRNRALACLLKWIPVFTGMKT
jgi:hypothetical protein